MVRTSRPLVERMTLVWHDWFATSNGQVGSQRLMLKQNALFRRRALGSFRDLLLDVTHDPAMLIFLSGVENTKDAPNENYGRELMELFTLGAGRGYTERDVREQARALTGWDSDWKDGVGQTNFRFLSKRHDDGVKTIFGKKGRFDWRDSCHLCLEHPSHRLVRRREALELLRAGAARRRHAGGARAALQGRQLRDQAARRRDPAPPGPLPRPGDGEAAGRLHGRAAAGARARDRHRGLGLARTTRPASGSSTRRTSPAGTTRAGSTRRPSAAAGTWPDTPCARPSSTRTR